MEHWPDGLPLEAAEPALAPGAWNPRVFIEGLDVVVLDDLVPLLAEEVGGHAVRVELLQGLLGICFLRGALEVAVEGIIARNLLFA